MTGKVGARDPALVNDAPAGHRPSGFDPARDKTEVIRGIVYVTPRLEPFAHGARKIGPLAVFLYCRWDAWGVGVQFLRAGVAVQIGPAMFGLCMIERQIEAFNAARAMEARQGGDACGSVHDTRADPSRELVERVRETLKAVEANRFSFPKRLTDRRWNEAIDLAVKQIAAVLAQGQSDTKGEEHE